MMIIIIIIIICQQVQVGRLTSRSVVVDRDILERPIRSNKVPIPGRARRCVKRLTNNKIIVHIRHLNNIMSFELHALQLYIDSREWDV